MQERPILMMPPLVMVLLSGFLLGSGFQPTTLISLGLLNLAVTGGWYRMLALATLNRPSGMDEFLSGIGRHFVQLVLGSLVFFLGLILLVAPWMPLAKRWAGDPSRIPFASLQVQLSKGDLSALDPGMLLTLSRWSLILSLVFLLYGLASYFLLLWKQAVVIRLLSWPQAWALSARMALKYWKPLFAILTVNGLAWLVAVVLLQAAKIFTGPLLALLTFSASFASLVAEVYFRAAFTVFFVQVEDEEKLLQ
ncbi:MAG TPA: hypothetical protein DD435_07105 [Cyanobacteria bacterium UBA8530]|nr:hypothetical protein [Cyanobacteria bacterium UBA8530]